MTSSIDWPLAIELAAVFVVFSFVRYRWFRARMRRHSAREAVIAAQRAESSTTLGATAPTSPVLPASPGSPSDDRAT